MKAANNKIEKVNGKEHKATAPLKGDSVHNRQQIFTFHHLSKQEIYFLTFFYKSAFIYQVYIALVQRHFDLLLIWRSLSLFVSLIFRPMVSPAIF